MLVQMREGCDEKLVRGEKKSARPSEKYVLFAGPDVNLDLYICKLDIS